MHPVLAAMRRNPLGPALIAVQIALTLAILSNALFIVNKRLAAMARPSGVDESQLFVIENQWVGKPKDIPARVQIDLAALRSLPGAAGAYATNTYPLSPNTWAINITYPDDASNQILTGMYMADSNTLRILGLQLTAGRNFSPDEVQNFAGFDSKAAPPDAMIITRQLAHELAPHGNVLGRLAMIPFPFGSHSPVRIVGIVKSLQVALPDPPPVFREGAFPAYNSLLLPYRDTAANSFYVVRAASPAQLGPVMKAATSKLYALSRARVLLDVESISTARRREYRYDRGQVIMLMAVSAVLLAMTAWGIVGLTSCWVNQRRRHIGIRRALGATRAAIVRQFQAENLLIAVAGILVGAGLAVGANLWLISHFQMARLDYRFVTFGSIAVLFIGQIGTLWPALRAAAVPPAEVTRA